MSKFSYILSGRTITVMVDGQTYQTDRSNPSWSKIKNALNDDSTTATELINLFQPIHGISQALAGEEQISIRGNAIYFGNEEIHSTLAQRMLDILACELDIDPWIKFANNVYANPFSSARSELYDFLEKAELPITPDGCFIAYKVVTNDYKDCFTKTIDNSIGQTVVMPGGRGSVDQDRTHLCSFGLHFCSKGYLNSYGTSGMTRVMLVKINPADVVSIPTDYNFAKGRCWRYEVVGEIDADQAGLIRWSPIESSYDDYEWDENETDPIEESNKFWDEL